MVVIITLQMPLAFADLGTALGFCNPAVYAAAPNPQLAFVQGCTKAFGDARRGSGLPLVVDTDALAAYSQLNISCSG